MSSMANGNRRDNVLIRIAFCVICPRTDGDIVTILRVCIRLTRYILDAIASIGTDGDVVTAQYCTACRRTNGYVLHALDVIAGRRADGNERTVSFFVIFCCVDTSIITYRD